MTSNGNSSWVTPQYPDFLFLVHLGQSACLKYSSECVIPLSRALGIIPHLPDYGINHRFLSKALRNPRLLNIICFPSILSSMHPFVYPPIQPLIHSTNISHLTLPYFFPFSLCSASLNGLPWLHALALPSVQWVRGGCCSSSLPITA